MKRGNVVWVNNPPAGPSAPTHVQAGRRPAIIIQRDSATVRTTTGERPMPTVVVVPFTTKLTARRFPDAVEVRATGSNGLTQDSVALIHQIVTVDRRLIAKIIGDIEPDDLLRIEAGVRALLSL